MQLTFRRKLYAAISLLAVGSTAGSLFYFYTQTKTILLEQMGDRLEDVGRTAIHFFSPEDLSAIRTLKTKLHDEMDKVGLVLAPIQTGEYKEILPTEVSERLMKGPEFQRLVAVLRKIKLSTRKRLYQSSETHSGDEPSLAYVTILSTVSASANHEVLEFIADADYDKPEAPNPVGNLFHNNSTALRKAFDGEVSSDRDYREEEGEVLFSAGLPIYDMDGTVLGILALDYNALGEANQVSRLGQLCFLIAAGSLLLSLTVASVLAGLFDKPVRKLMEGADRVRMRDFSTQIELKSNDELGLLAGAFNSMVREIRNYASGLEALNTAYARFVPKAFLEQLGEESIVNVKLGQQVQKQMTILFSDIRSFTSISETMSPRDNFDFINEYLSLVSPIIRKHGGFIDKYIGDGIMALFAGSAEGAIQSAIEMQHALVQFNEVGKNLGRPAIQIGVGLHSGNLMLGTVGEEERMDGTVISDAVNLAARLEGLTKEYGARIIVSERLLNSLTKGESFHARCLGQASVKGKQQATMIFEILDGDEDDVSRKKIVSKPYFERGIRALEKGDYLRARKFFKRALQLHKHDAAASLFLKKASDGLQAKGLSVSEEERKKIHSINPQAPKGVKI